MIGVTNVDEQVYLNGSFVPYEKALLPVEDRATLFADGVYEVVRIYGGRPLAMKAHMERMARSAREIRLPEVDFDELAHRGLELVERNGVGDGSLYIQVSRGVAPRNHLFPVGVAPTVFATARELARPAESLRQNGVACITVPDIRWGRCDIKTVALLPNVLAKQEARDRGVYDAIFVRDGVVTEATSANVFAVVGGEVVTHPEGSQILPGITRRLVAALAAEAGIPLAYREIRAQELAAAAELFISGTTTEIMPVVEVDGRKVGTGKPGPITRRLIEKYDELVEKTRRGDPDVPLA